MTKKSDRPIEVGDRFESRDGRDGGRIVEVIEALGLSAYGRARIAAIKVGPKRNTWGESQEARIERNRQQETHFRIRTEVHPNNPSAVGRRVKIQENTLREKYKRVSR